MKPPRVPATPVVVDDPTEFDRAHEFGKGFIGPREFARRTQGTRSETAMPRVLVEDTSTST